MSDYLGDIDSRFPHDAFGTKILRSEFQVIMFVRNNLSSLRDQTQKFIHALELFDFCQLELENRREIADPPETSGTGQFKEIEKYFAQVKIDIAAQSRFRSWSHIAAREAAMTLFEFHRCMAFATKNTENTQEFKQRIDNKIVDQAMKLFTNYFPDAKEIRHTASHRIDFFGTPENTESHAIRGPLEIPGVVKLANEGFVSLNSVIAGRTVTSTGFGKNLDFEFSEETVGRLAEITCLFYSAFKVPS